MDTDDQSCKDRYEEVAYMRIWPKIDENGENRIHVVDPNVGGGKALMMILVGHFITSLYELGPGRHVFESRNVKRVLMMIMFC